MTFRYADLCLIVACMGLGACSAPGTQAAASSDQPSVTSVPIAGQAATIAGAGATKIMMPALSTAPAAPNKSAAAAGQAAPVMPASSTPGMASVPPTMPAMTPPAAPATAAAGAGAPAGMMPEPSADPEDGDASKPVVSNPDMACRPGGGGFGLNQPNYKIDDRDVIIDYPCNKHEGAPMTFILNLHGTTPVEQHFYQEGYFSAWQFVASHNLIIATPSSVVQQWGNMDDGKDEPYLMDVIAYVYKAFAKFEIKQMWVGGHSWGAFYTSQFGCKPELADKVKGLIIMSGASTVPSCSSKMSLLNTVAEMDIGPAIDFQSLPMQHGCGAEMSATLGKNQETFWPGCSAPFVHAKYMMLGKMHADFMDKEVVQSLVDWIKLSRQMQR